MASWWSRGGDREAGGDGPGAPRSEPPQDDGRTPRQAMDAALKSVVVSELRARGFTGSLPHLRQRTHDGIRLISIQYFSSGGSFVVEVATCPAQGFATYWGKEIPVAKVTAQDVDTRRPRLGSPGFPDSGDHWFVFGPRSYEEGARDLMPSAHYEAVAAHVLALVDQQAEPFWQSHLG